MLKGQKHLSTRWINTLTALIRIRRELRHIYVLLSIFGHLKMQCVMCFFQTLFPFLSYVGFPSPGQHTLTVSSN